SDEKGPAARRRTMAAREAYLPYVERAAEGANAADGPLSSVWLDFLDLSAAEESLRPHEQHDEQERERHDLAVGDGLRGHERFREPDDQASHHRTRDVAETAEHDHGEAFEPECDPEVWAGDAHAQADERPRHAAEEAADDERQQNEAIGVDP